MQTLAPRRLVGSLACCIASVVLAAPEAAAQPLEGWLERYQAPAGCPSEASFREQVQRRLAGAPAGLARARVSVQISRASSAPNARPVWRSELSLGDAAAEGFGSELVDSSCTALVQALALVVALRIDAEPAAPPERSSPPPSEPAAAIDAAPSRSVRRGQVLRVGAAVLGSVRSALGPTPALGVGAGVSLEWETALPWAPRVELAIARFEAQPLHLSSEAALHFESWLASVSACPVRWTFGSHVSLRPCLDLDVGQLTGVGSGRAVVGARPQRAPWLSTGASLRAALVPFGGPLEVGLAAGPSLPLPRHEFFFAPNIEGFAVPLVGWRGTAAIAWSF